MYRDLSKKKWQSWWKISSKDKPDVLILWGIFKSIAEEGFWSVPEFLMYQFEEFNTHPEFKYFDIQQYQAIYVMIHNRRMI